jgi:hypothetical protein
MKKKFKKKIKILNVSKKIIIYFYLKKKNVFYLGFIIN